MTPNQRDQRNTRARQRRLEERKQRVVDLLDKAAQTAWEFRDEPFWRELMFTIVSVSSVHDAVYSRRMVDAGVRAENLSPFVGAATLHFTRKDLDGRVQRSFEALRAERTAPPEESGVTLCSADADISAAVGDVPCMDLKYAAATNGTLSDLLTRTVCTSGDRDPLAGVVGEIDTLLGVLCHRLLADAQTDDPVEHLMQDLAAMARLRVEAVDDLRSGGASFDQEGGPLQECFASGIGVTLTGALLHETEMLLNQLDALLVERQDEGLQPICYMAYRRAQAAQLLHGATKVFAHRPRNGVDATGGLDAAAEE